MEPPNNPRSKPTRRLQPKRPPKHHHQTNPQPKTGPNRRANQRKPMAILHQNRRAAQRHETLAQMGQKRKTRKLAGLTARPADPDACPQLPQSRATLDTGKKLATVTHNKKTETTHETHNNRTLQNRTTTRRLGVHIPPPNIFHLARNRQPHRRSTANTTITPSGIQSDTPETHTKPTPNTNRIGKNFKELRTAQPITRSKKVKNQKNAKLPKQKKRTKGTMNQITVKLEPETAAALNHITQHHYNNNKSHTIRDAIKHLIHTRFSKTKDSYHILSDVKSNVKLPDKSESRDDVISD